MSREWDSVVDITASGKKRLVLVTGRAHPQLAIDIAAELGADLVHTDARTFANGEIYARFDESVRGSDAFVIQSHTYPINEWLMEQLIMVDALKRASAKRITVVAPFYPYARQDKKGRGREPISARLVADLFKAAGADRIMSVDLHAAQIQGFFDGPVDHLFAMPVLLKYFQEKLDAATLTVVSPDMGRVRVADIWSDKLGAPLAIIHKRRDPLVPNKVTVHEIVGDVDGRTCLIVDDMIDTGGTIVKAAEALKLAGAVNVVVAATHAVFSSPASEILQSDFIDEVVVTDTLPIPPEKRFPTLTILPIAPLIASCHPRGVQRRFGHLDVRRRGVNDAASTSPAPTEYDPPRPWLASYAEGVPETIELPSGSLYDLVEESVSNYPDNVALEFFGRETTYADMGEQILRAAEGLRLLGVQKGDTVALVLPNCPQHIVAFYAALRLGAIVVEHNPLYTPRELRHQFEDHGAKVAIVWNNVVQHVQDFPADVAVETVVSVDVTRAMPFGTRFLLRLPIARARESRSALTTKVRGTVTWEKLLENGAVDAHIFPAGLDGCRAHPVHVRHDRHPQGRHSHAPESLGERGPGPRLGAHRQARHLRGLCGSPDVPRLRPHALPHLRHADGRATRALPQAFEPVLVLEGMKKHPADLPSCRTADLPAAQRGGRRTEACRSRASTSRSRGPCRSRQPSSSRGRRRLGGWLIEGYGLSRDEPRAHGQPGRSVASRGHRR